MKGVYVLDLDNGFVCIMVAQSSQDAQERLPFELSTIESGTHSSAMFDGSYHYYPMMVGESDDDAEKRVFILTAKRYGIGCILVRAEIRDSIGRGTWSSDFQNHLRKTLYGSIGHLEDSSSVSVSATDKDAVFSMSI